MELDQSNDFLGYWSPRTANNEWCEENYVVTHYVAEFWNTISNIGYILIGFVTAIQAYRDKTERRHIYLGLSLLAVGIGSWLFHMTLRYTMQMFDVMPMLWLVAVGLYALVQVQAPRNSINYPVLLSLLVIVTVISVVTAFADKPLFFHVTFAIFTTADLILSVILVRRHDCNVNYIKAGVVALMLAVGSWMVDRTLCPQLRSLRNGLPLYAQPILQLHAWWHIFSCLATMFNLFFIIDMRSRYLRLGTKVNMKWHVIPYMEQNRWVKECA